MEPTNNQLGLRQALEERGPRNLPVALDTYRPAASNWEAEAEPPTIPLSHYLWILKRHRWKILAFVAACVAGTLIVSSRMIPIYESTAIVDIDRQMPADIIGESASRSLTNDADQFLSTQIDLIQSDSVLRPVAQQYRLREVERQEGGGEGDEEQIENAPTRLKNLKVTRPANTYLLHIRYRARDRKLAASVANAIAHSYLERTYEIRFRSSSSLAIFMEKQMDELKAKMERSGSALAQFERELNVINPEEKTSILSARLLQLNTEATNAQAERARKQSAHESVATGSIEAAQVSTQGESLKRLNEKLADAQQTFADVHAHYGPNHPEFRKAQVQVAEIERQVVDARDTIARRVEAEYREALTRESILRNAVAETKAEFDKINARSFEYQTVKREAEEDKKLYDELVRKIKEAGINAGFQNNSIRIADLARPGFKPVAPNVKLNLLLAFLFSALLAVGAAVLRDMLDNTIRDPEQVAKDFKTEVISSLPAMRNWRYKLASAKDASQSLVPMKEASDPGLSAYQESIRSLRNSILLTDFDRRLRTLLVTSASPREGKSTTAANLAVAHAQQQHKTLLIDGDLRRPSVHKFFNISSSVGLSNVLLAKAAWRDVIVKPEGIANLDILAAGPPSRSAGDLIGTGLLQLLDEVSEEYDLVILDAPPLLGFAEPLQMASFVDGVIVIARAGETGRKAVGSVLNTLARLRANVLGVVLNEVHKDMSDSYSYYGNYRGYYRGYDRREEIAVEEHAG